MIPRDILYLTEDEVAQCMTAEKAGHLAEKGIIADGAGDVAGNKFYMNVGDGGFIKPFCRGNVWGDREKSTLPGVLWNYIEEIWLAAP